MVESAIGFVTLVAGIGAMFWQWQMFQWETREKSSTESQLFKLRKFRRRTLMSAMIAIVGALIAANSFAEDPRTSAILVSAMLLILLCLLVFAFVDIARVYVYFNHGPEAGKARKELAMEYKRMRDKADQMAREAQESEGDTE